MSSKPPSDSVFVGNIPYTVSEEQIREIFKSVGEILEVKLVVDSETGRPKGYGFIRYTDMATAASAVRNLNDYEIGTRKLRVDFSSNSRGGDDSTAAAGYHDIPSASNGVAMAPNPSNTSLPPLPLGIDLPEGLSCHDAISRTLGTLPPPQLLDVLSQMKTLATTDSVKATELLRQAPQLSYAIFQALLLMGLISPEALAGVVEAAQHASPAASYPPGYPPPPPHMSGQLGMPIGTPPVQGHAAYPPPPPPGAPPVAQPQASDTEALMRQVMEMPQHLIDNLPPAERTQIMQLRAAYGR